MNFFLSPGFGGLCAVIGAAIAYGAATLATRQKSRTDVEQRRQGEVARAWDRFVWVMEQRDRFDPVLTARLLGQLTDTAERLGDQDLVAIGREIGDDLFDDSDVATPVSTSTTAPNPADSGLIDQQRT